VQEIILEVQEIILEVQAIFPAVQPIFPAVQPIFLPVQAIFLPAQAFTPPSLQKSLDSQACRTPVQPAARTMQRIAACRRPKLNAHERRARRFP